MQQKNGGGNYNLEYTDLHVHTCVLSQVQLFAAPWTVAHQAPLSMGFLRQKYWRGMPFPALRYLPHLWIELTSLILAGRFFTSKLPVFPGIPTQIQSMHVRL